MLVAEVLKRIKKSELLYRTVQDLIDILEKSNSSKIYVNNLLQQLYELKHVIEDTKTDFNQYEQIYLYMIKCNITVQRLYRFTFKEEYYRKEAQECTICLFEQLVNWNEV